MNRRFFSEAKVEGVFVLLNRVCDDEMESYLLERLAEGGMEPIGAIPEDPAITAAWLRGASLGGYHREIDDEILLAMDSPGSRWRSTSAAGKAGRRASRRPMKRKALLGR